jgi:hypothetical protein
MAAGLTKAFGIGAADMYGAVNMMPRAIPASWMPGMGPAACCDRTKASANWMSDVRERSDGRMRSSSRMKSFAARCVRIIHGLFA